MAAKPKIPDGRIERLGNRINFTKVHQPLGAEMAAHVTKNFPTVSHLEPLPGVGDFTMVFETEAACREVMQDLFNEPNTARNSPFLDHMYPGSYEFHDVDFKDGFVEVPDVPLSGMKSKRRKTKKK